MINSAPCVLREQIGAAFQQIGIASDLQINRLKQRANVREGGPLKARSRCFKPVTDLDSWDGEKSNSTTDCLVVVVIRIAVEIERACGTSIEGTEGRAIRHIKSVIHPGRADWKSSARL